jgi:hypothetical protein
VNKRFSHTNTAFFHIAENDYSQVRFENRAGCEQVSKNILRIFYRNFLFQRPAAQGTLIFCRSQNKKATLAGGFGFFDANIKPRAFWISLSFWPQLFCA